MAPITAIVTTFNEEGNIGECLDSLKFADEILVVDSFSTDGTVRVAREKGATVLEHEYVSPSAQKNWAIPQAKHEWVLILDADERVPADLAQEIARAVSAPDCDGYWIKRRNFFLGREIRHSGWQNDWVLRLFRRDQGRYEERQIHERMVVEGKVGRLRGRLLHYSYRSMEDYWRKLERYADWNAREMLRRGKRVSRLYAAVHPPLRFLKAYLLQAGFLDGRAGLTVSLLSARYAAAKDARVREMWREMRTGEAAPEGKPRARWLVISHAANISGEACSHHIDDRLPHLRGAGVEVEMITSICGPRPPGWGNRWHRVPSLLPSGYQFEVRQITKSMRQPWRSLLRLLLVLPVYPLYAAEKYTLGLYSTFGWWMSAALAGLWYTGRRRPDLIYSTGGAVSAHVAAMVVSRLRGIPWIAELQDPLIHQGVGRGAVGRRIIAWLERMIHTHAGGVVYVTRTACERAAARTGGRSPCVAIYPGAELYLPPKTGDPEKLLLAHLGTLDKWRSPRTLLEAMKRLAERRPEARDHLRLALVGRMGRSVKEMVASFPFPDMVDRRDKVPRAEARALATRADVLVVIQHALPVSEETIPSKTYEYLAGGRAVLGLVYRNRELAEMLTTAGHAAVEVDDAAGIEAALEELYERWRRGELSAGPSTCYTTASAATELVSFARRVCGGREAALRAGGEKE